MWRSRVHALASNGGLASGSRRDEASFAGVGRGGSLRSESGKPPPPSILLGCLVSGEVAGGGGVGEGGGHPAAWMQEEARGQTATGCQEVDLAAHLYCAPAAHRDGSRLSPACLSLSLALSFLFFVGPVY